VRDEDPSRRRARGTVVDPGTEMLELIEMTINRVFSISLILAAANESLGDHPTSVRLSEAIAHMDTLIRDLRLAAFSRQIHHPAQVDAVQDHLRRALMAMTEAWPPEGPESAGLVELAEQLGSRPPSPEIL
jgi:hypothetical protein